MSYWHSWVKALFHLVYPRYCICCNKLLVEGENWVCQHCAFDLPFVTDDDSPENETANILAGRLIFDNARSVLHFQKGNKTQELLHQLKYKGNQPLGIDLGKLAGWYLRNSSVAKADAIVPVPLHPEKQRTRGYNQSVLIAQGIGTTFGIPVWADVVVRRRPTSTQTRLGRYERWENVEDVFEVIKPNKIVAKHLLLIDDVLTTGATLEACGHALLAVEGVRLSVVTLAKAVR